MSGLNTKNLRLASFPQELKAHKPTKKARSSNDLRTEVTNINFTARPKVHKLTGAESPKELPQSPHSPFAKLKLQFELALLEAKQSLKGQVRKSKSDADLKRPTSANIENRFSQSEIALPVNFSYPRSNSKSNSPQSSTPNSPRTLIIQSSSPNLKSSFNKKSSMPHSPLSHD